MPRMTAPETSELIASLIADAMYDMVNEYDGEEDLALVTNTENAFPGIAHITLDNGRRVVINVYCDDTYYK